jgi:hypothetical protein
MLLKTAKRARISVLKAGYHVATLVKMHLINLPTEKSWADPTRQVEFVFENTEGTIKHWCNLDGFVNKTDLEEGGLYFTGKGIPAGFELRSTEGYDESYLVNSKTGKRVLHTRNLLIVKGKETVVEDKAIDAMITKGDNVEFAQRANAKGKLVDCESKCRKANRMFAEAIVDLGFPVDQDIDTDNIEEISAELTNSEVGIKVREIEGSEKTEIHYFIEADKAQELMDATDL